MDAERRTVERRLTERREKRGRKPVLADPHQLGSVWVEVSLYDRVAVYAIRHHKTNIAAAVRDLLEAGLLHLECNKSERN